MWRNVKILEVKKIAGNCDHFVLEKFVQYFLQNQTENYCHEQEKTFQSHDYSIRTFCNDAEMSVKFKFL